MMRRLQRRGAVIGCALALDLLIGEPPSGVHPVVWMGRATSLLERHAPASGAARQLAWGGLMAVALPAAAALTGAVMSHLAGRRGFAGIVAEAAALNGLFALRGLLAAGRNVQAALEAADAEAGRAALRALVSRETAHLRPELVAAAAIESLAENLTDSVLAPWLAYLAGGLPAAAAYRAVNTLDSMIGYRGRYEYLGKASARLDDLLNLLPARLAAFLLIVAAPAGGGSAPAAVAAVGRYRAATASPNAGWTMSAMAGALGVRLEKSGHYTLGAGREPASTDIARAAVMVATAAALALAPVAAVAAVAGRRARGSGGGLATARWAGARRPTPRRQANQCPTVPRLARQGGVSRQAG